MFLRSEIADGIVHPNCWYHPGHHEDRARQYRLQYALLSLPREVERERVVIQRGTTLDQLKTQTENNSNNRQSNHQKPEITDQAYQSRVIRSLQGVFRTFQI